jgi:hypothetical protein
VDEVVVGVVCQGSIVQPDPESPQQVLGLDQVTVVDPSLEC